MPPKRAVLSADLEGCTFQANLHFECGRGATLSMGKGAMDVDSEICACSCYLSVADVCEASSAGHFKVWFHAADCWNLQCGQNCLSEEGGCKKSVARIGDFRDIVRLLSILSSQFCSNLSGQPEHLSAKRIHPICKRSPKTVLWSGRAWGAISAAVLLVLLFPSILPRTPAHGNNLGLNNWLHTIPQKRFTSQEYKPAATAVSPFPMQGFPSMFSFQEAPPFCNQMGCPIPPENAFVCDPSSVHIVMTLDGAYLRGSLAAVFSILQHAACPENVVFHFLVTEYDSWFQSLVRSIFPFLKFKIYHFEASVVRDLISSSVRQALEQPLNYARNYMADLLEPCVRRVIYLDSDLVVVDDIFKLWTTKLGSHTIAAPEYCHANFTKYFSSSFWRDPVLSRTFQGRKPCYFNTGVMVINLDQWRRKNCTEKIEHWMQVQKELRIYELGSLPPFLLVFAGSVEPVEHRWNQHGLGGDNVKGSCRSLHPGPVSLLHWSGEGKPWSRLDSRHPCPLDSLWAPFDLFVNSSL